MYKQINEYVQYILDTKNVFIDIYKPLEEFYIDGEIMEGKLKDNKVLLADKLCIRYNNYDDFIDIEVYGHGRQCWYSLNPVQFTKIIKFIQIIH